LGEKVVPFAARTKTAALLVGAKKLEAICKYIFEKRGALLGNAFCALGLRDPLVVVRDMTMREATKGDGQFVAIVLYLNVAEVWMRRRESDRNSILPAQSHGLMGKTAAQLWDETLGYGRHDG
jgi:hypothetical protein